MINILFAGNEGVFDGILTTILSIFKRSKIQDTYRFYILTMDVSRIDKKYVPISEKQITFLNQIVKNYSLDSEVIKIDVSNLYQDEFAYCPNEDAYCSPYTLIRLFIDQIDILPDKLLYLDVDIMFNQDIHLLYDIDINDYEYAASRDHYGKYLVHPNYINAGVMLLNLKMIKKTGLFKKARQLIKSKKLVFADQSAIIRSTTKKKMLPQKFNDQKFLHKWTVVRHFSKRLFYLPYPHTDNIKQWHVSKVHKVFKYYQFDDILFEYIYFKQKFEKEIK